MNVRDIIDAARAATGLSDPGDPTALEGLEVLVRASDAEASLSTAGAQRWEANIVNILSNRLRIVDYLKKHPELLERPVERPMFVFGLPRTGTTLTINLLSADPMRRCLLRWEALNPVPPAAAGELHSDPRRMAEQERLAMAVKYASQIAAAHYEDADSRPSANSRWRCLSARRSSIPVSTSRAMDIGSCTRRATCLPSDFTSSCCNCCKRRTRGAGP